MSESFSKGDLVEVTQAKPGDVVGVGARGQVITPFVEDWRGIPYVEVDYGIGSNVHSQPHCIRKIQPPKREPTSTWDDVIVWKPREVTHV